MNFLPPLLLLLSLILQTRALHFYLEGSQQKCFLEELPGDTTVVGNYKTEEWSSDKAIYAPNEHVAIQITVEQVHNRHRVLNQRGANAGRFAFSTAEPGEYSICMSTSGSSGWFSSSTKTKFYLDLLFGDATHDQAAPDLKKKALSDLALRLRELNVKISNIRREQQYQKDREAQFRDTSESANAHVRNWTILQLVVLGVTCMWQLSHLRKFFVAKKLV